ncbi:beta-ketoacyl-ACP synthase III [Candidatus Pacearchaeota archaeon]|nr:beta-ketoacyl-ACP synthase III [Candidatus Pacearchaeota archaeon]
MIRERSVKIAGIGRYLPNKKVSSEELDFKLRLPIGTVKQISGVKNRYYVNGETASEMGSMAVLEALKDAQTDISEIDCMVSASGVSEQPIPPNSSLIAEKLKMQDKKTFCYDINSSCMSFVTALDELSCSIEIGKYEKVLIVSSDITSRGVDYEDLKSASLFGDGAAAVVIARDPERKSKIICSHGETYCEGAHFSEIIGGGNKMPATEYNPELNRKSFLYSLQGTKMARVVFEKIWDFFNTAFAPLGKSLEEIIADVKAVIPHQVSPSFVRNLRDLLKIPAEKLIDLTREYGNMLSVSVPLGLYESIKSGIVKRGDRILIVGGGSGISLGTIYLQY